VDSAREPVAESVLSMFHSGMGANWRPQTIMDYGRRDLDIAVRCLRCDRAAVYAVGDLSLYFTSRGWPVTLPIDPKRFVCRCRSKDLIIEAVPRSSRPNPLPEKEVVLQPIYVRPGRGWHTATHKTNALLPAELALLRFTIIEDPTKRLAWRVHKKHGECHAELRCGCPWAGADPLFSASGASHEDALRRVADDALSYWRGIPKTK
jgi:hypothetical protein